jgi:hypothetical protein
MNIQILYYTRKDFGGWRKYTWLPVQWAQGKFVHCEMLVDGKILNASNINGVVWSGVGPFRPSGEHRVEVDKIAFEQAVDSVMGQEYSWSGFFKLLWPRWGSDPKGMICSELVANILKLSAFEEIYRIPFIAVPPHRWTPNQIYTAIDNIKFYKSAPYI